MKKKRHEEKLRRYKEARKYRIRFQCYRFLYFTYYARNYCLCVVLSVHVGCGEFSSAVCRRSWIRLQSNWRNTKDISSMSQWNHGGNGRAKRNTHENGTRKTKTAFTIESKGIFLQTTCAEIENEVITETHYPLDFLLHGMSVHMCVWLCAFNSLLCLLPFVTFCLISVGFGVFSFCCSSRRVFPKCAPLLAEMEELLRYLRAR